MSHRCCQNGLVSVWTVPQDPSSYSQSSTACLDAWWESESRSRLMVLCPSECFKNSELRIITLLSVFMSVCVLSPAEAPVVWRSGVCVSAEGSHDSRADNSVQSRWACFGVRRGWWTFEHLVIAGQYLLHMHLL